MYMEYLFETSNINKYSLMEKVFQLWASRVFKLNAVLKIRKIPIKNESFLEPKLIKKSQDYVLLGREKCSTCIAV